MGRGWRARRKAPPTGPVVPSHAPAPPSPFTLAPAPERPAASPWASGPAVPPSALAPVSDEPGATTSSRRRWSLVSEDGVAVPLPATSVTVGRRLSTDPGPGHVMVPDPRRTVSKRHARLTLTGRVWLVEDLGSTNGTRVVDAAGREAPLAPGAPAPTAGVIRLGEATFVIRADAAQP